MKKSLLFALVALLGFPLAALAAITGDCSGCHTMHNSEQGQEVAERFNDADQSPIDNLLRFDCLACHAQGGTDNVVDVLNNLIPQVYHTNVADLAGGNFAYISGTKTGHASASGTTGNRKGHNVFDLVGNDTTAGYTRPPGFPESGGGGTAHNNAFGTGNFNEFTCAGAAGCHGTRNQEVTAGVNRVGMKALSGAHHQSENGKRTPAQVDAGAHNGSLVAAGYRFIPGLIGMGNTTVGAEWQNAGPGSHNEYYGSATDIFDGLGTTCDACHVGAGQQKDLETSIKVPNQSMSGFCSTCHGDFHSSGSDNGSSGAFLRHPSDYILPGTGTEYAGYTQYNITAPVARSASFFATLTTTPSSSVSGTTNGDMVMCLSCHVAHASPYDGMLRFDYATLTSAMKAGGILTGTDRDGCLACHTNK